MQGSDKYARVAVHVISNLRRLVIKASMDKPSDDPIAEEQTDMQFENFVCGKGFAPLDGARCSRLLGTVVLSHASLRQQEFVAEAVGSLQVDEVVLEVEHLPEAFAFARAIFTLGQNPKEVRNAARKAMEEGEPCLSVRSQ